MAKLLRDFVKVQNDFTIIPNEILRNKEMKSSVKNILLTMFSLPPEWDFSISGIACVVAEGRDTVQKALVELEKIGYITRTRDRKENGTLGAMIYTIHQFPVSKEKNTYKKNFQSQDGKEPIHEKTNIGEKPTLDSKSQLRTDYNKLSKDKELSTEKELSIDKYTFPDKSEKGDDIYTSLSDGKEEAESNQPKPNRYIPDDYTEEQLREHIRPIIKENFERIEEENEIRHDQFRMDMFEDIVVEFYRQYEQNMGVKHRIVPDKTLIAIMERYITIDEPAKGIDDFETYKKVIEHYFNTDFNKRGKYKGEITLCLSHFMTNGIINYLLNREGILWERCDDDDDDDYDY